ncbi:MAG: ATP-dependent Clp protease ATP-binding subunit [Patescibacteria group bacterium]|nr:ATP-dependent Clp protease ATP-binding subunit [Patescibacteria group bacterium]
MHDILDKFTDHLKKTVATAHAIAAEMRSPGLNPEHLVLALLRQEGSVGGELLRRAEVDAETTRRLLKLADDVAANQGQPAEVASGAPRLSQETKRVFEKTVLIANQHNHKYVGTEHLLAGLLQAGSPAVAAILANQSVDVAGLQEQVEQMLKSTTRFPEIAESFETGDAPHSSMSHAPRAEKDDEAENAASIGRRSGRNGRPRTPTLDTFTVDLTANKPGTTLDPVIGRDAEIERLIQILCRRTKNNPVLLGEPGVGKTAIVEGLAKRIIEGEVPDVLANKRILALDLGLIIAGTVYRGEFESRLKQITEETKNNPDIILFIDELHNITGAGSTNGSLDAANLLKPALARGELRCIGATTPAEFKKSIESDGALERRFQAIMVEPPSMAAAKEILRGLRANYEKHHGVTVTDEAIDAAVELSDRYLTDRFLPDKAIDLIDEASACVRVATSGRGGARRVKDIEEEIKKTSRQKDKSVASENFLQALELKAQERRLEKELAAMKKRDGGAKPPAGSIGRREVAEVVARATGIPAADLLREEKERLLKLEEELKRRIVGQDDAVASVAEMMRRAKAGVADPKRPLASFLFLGPSGVGKTEMAKVIAETVFHDPEALIRIDMSEFAEGFNVSKLIGAPAGYVGYKDRTKLTDTVKRRPHSVVLFDEIEKAHDEIHNLFLQLLEDGQLTDATGRRINFRNSVIVMTSNVGAASAASEDIGFGSKKAGEVTAADIAEARERILKEMEKSFRPEFINRIDQTVVFKPLSRQNLVVIAEQQLRELAARLERDHGVKLVVAPKAAVVIAERSWNPLFGARGVRRQIQELVESPLARELLTDALPSGVTLRVGVGRDGQINVTHKQQHAHATV